MELTIKKIGKSLGIIIPKETVKQRGLKEGDTVKVEFYHANSRMNGFGMFRNGPSFKREYTGRDDRW